jgi:hypothetical protein
MAVTSKVLVGYKLEYKALRDELLKRFELRQQVVSVTLAIAGALIGAGIFQAKILYAGSLNGPSPSIALAYPPIAALLALGWAHLDDRVRVLGSYIRERLEPNIPGLGWEGYNWNNRPRVKRLPYAFISHGGVFIWTQVVAMIVGALYCIRTQPKLDPLDYALLIIDVVAFLWTIYIMVHHAQHVTGIDKKGLKAFEEMKLDPIGWLP